MSEVRSTGVAADTKVETPEGSMAIRTCAGKGIPVLSRNEESAVLFRMMLDVQKIAEAHPVLKITLENGASFRVAPEQVIFRADMNPVAASGVRPGVALMPAFRYPAGYQYATDGGDARVSEGSLKVARVEAAGTADVYALKVNETGCFFLAAGVLCKADPV